MGRARASAECRSSVPPRHEWSPMTRHWLLRTVASSFAALHLSCGDHGPSAPAVGALQQSAETSLSGVVRGQNVPPNLVVRTTPAADYSTNPPTISGTPPLNVLFNLCPSNDSD